jgi:hypothetical protein
MTRSARGDRWSWPARCILLVVTCGSLLAVTVCFGVNPAAAAAPARAAVANTGPGPRPAYRCNFNVGTDAFTGADGTASAIGWLGDHNSVITCLGGTFVIQDGPGGLFGEYGFGIYDGQRTTWDDADGYLPAQVTTFSLRPGVTVAITEFADRLVLHDDAYVAVYSRVHVVNATGRTITADPLASPGLVPLNDSPDAVPAHHDIDHDYVVVSDRFGSLDPWPSADVVRSAGGVSTHFAHMRAFWNAQLAAIARINVPDRALVDAYESGFITTQLTRSGNDLDTGVNGYESEFSHDVVGILTTLFTQGSYSDAQALLTEARTVVGAPGQYVDGVWTYSVPWAVYLLKTGNTAFVAQNFSAGGTSPSEPSIEAAAHAIAADRTGPMGTMEATDDIDTQGYWTTDDFEALLGLAAYRYLASALGNASEASWASAQYASLLTATNAVLTSTISLGHLDYLPCSLVQANSANRCNNPKDANWTSPIGNWAWEASLFGAPVDGPGLSMIDATYDYGFDRLHGLLPPDTTGGFPGDYYSSAYNAAQGAAGLASSHHRDQGISNFEFMLANTQSGPLSWWESSSAPDPTSPWVGRHPSSGQGSSPHAWGMAGADKVLLDSLAAQRSDGSLVVGRGLPPGWLDRGTPISVTNFPTTAGHRVTITVTSAGRSVSLSLRGTPPPGPVLLQLPSFSRNIASASSGTVDHATGTVTLAPHVRHVTVTLQRAP